METEQAINQGGVETRIENGIATIEFQHPLSNSLPGKVLAKLAANITEAGKNDKIKVIVLKSAGDRAFCAGASFDELISIDNLDTGKQFFSGFANVINAARKCPKIIVGRVQGKAVGGGVGMISATDICFATKFAAVRLSELAIGIGPFVVGPAVQRRVGQTRFAEMSISPAKWYNAEWAATSGLYAEVFETVEELDNAVAEKANELANYNPEALGLLKEVFWKGAENWDELLAERAAMSGKLVLSDFTRNAIEKFKQK